MESIRTKIYKNNIFLRTARCSAHSLVDVGRFLIATAFVIGLGACGGGPEVATPPSVEVTPSEPPPLSSLTLLRGVVSGSSENNTLFKNVADGYKQTYWMPESTSGEYISLSDLRGEISAVFVNERYNAISAWRLVNDDSGEVLAEGSKLGKQTIRFPPVRISKISLMIDAATYLPRISQLEVYSKIAPEDTDPVKQHKNPLMEINHESRKSACKHSTGLQEIWAPIVVEDAFDGGCQTFTMMVLGNGVTDREIPVFVMKEGGSLSNVILGENDSNIEVFGDADLKNITWSKVLDSGYGLVVKAKAKVSISNFEGNLFLNGMFQINSQASIVAKNCTLKGNGRNVFRHSGKCYPINVSVDNCFVEDLRDAVFHSDCKNSSFDITNSTIVHVPKICYNNKSSCAIRSSYFFKLGGHELDNKKALMAEVDGSSSIEEGSYTHVSDPDKATYWSPSADNERSFLRLNNLTDLVSTVVVLSEGYRGAWRLINDDTGEQLDAGSYMGTLLIADFPAVMGSKIRLIFDDNTAMLKVTGFEAYGPRDTVRLEGMSDLEGASNIGAITKIENTRVIAAKDQKSACKKSTGSQIVTSPIIVTDEFDGQCKTFYADFFNFRKENKGFQPALFRINSGGSLKNVIFGAGSSSDSIHVYADTSLTDISWANFRGRAYGKRKSDGLKVMAPADVTINRFDAGNSVSQLFQINAQSNFVAKNCTTNGIDSFVSEDQEACNALDVSVDNCAFGDRSYSALADSACGNSAWHISNSHIEHTKFCAEGAENCETVNSTWTSIVGEAIPRDATLAYGTVEASSTASDSKLAYLTDGDHNTVWVSEPSEKGRISISGLSGLITAVAIYTPWGNSYALGTWRLVNDDTGEVLVDGALFSHSNQVMVIELPAVRASKISLYMERASEYEYKIKDLEVYVKGESGVVLSAGHSLSKNNILNKGSSFSKDNIQSDEGTEGTSRNSACTASAGLIKVGEPIVVSDAFDGRCKLYVRYFAKDESPDLYGNEPLFKIETGGSLNNVMMGYSGDTPAVEVNADTVLANVTWIDANTLDINTPVSVSVSNFEVYDPNSFYTFSTQYIGVAENFVAKNCTVETHYSMIEIGKACGNLRNGLVDNCQITNIGGNKYSRYGVFYGRNTCESATWQFTNGTAVNQALCYDQANDCLMP